MVMRFDTVLFDRDGTLIENVPYLSDPVAVRPMPHAVATVARARAQGLRVGVVTNQSGIGRGYYTLADAENVNTRVCADFAPDGVRFEKIYIAPEAPDQPSRGRKPSPQFLFDARDEFGIALAESFMIGDKLIDLECGWNAGIKKSILVRTGYGAETERDFPAKLGTAVVVTNLPAAAAFILENSQT